MLRSEFLRTKYLRRGFAAALALAAAVSISAQLPPSGEAQNILAFLNQTIVWYQQITAQQQQATEPSDAVLVNQNRQYADAAARLSFDFARARAQQLPNVNAPLPTSNADSSQAASPPSRSQNLAAAVAATQAEVKHDEQEIATLQQQLPAASGKKRALIEAQLPTEQSELALQQARLDTLQNYISFTAGATAKGAKSGSLQAQIEELASALPGVAMATKPAATTAVGGAAAVSVPAVATSKQEGNGLFSLFSDVLRLRKKLQTLDTGLQLTDSLANLSQTLRDPLVKDLRDLTQRGDALAAEPDPTDLAGLAQKKNETDALTAEFKRLSASVLPLGKQAVLLDLYKRNLSVWRAGVQSEYSSTLKSLAFRLALLIFILGMVLAFSELWRRATFRYIHDKRRRFQFLLIRRIVVTSLIVIIVVLALASEISSLATFAGLLTAGLAVALQNVILSVVGYFFLIGKHGFRVGDRVQVAGVTGNIIDIGLLRLHLMEVGGFGHGDRPTGRVVVFPNAVVFQANSGLFKQAPGTKFVWHEIRVMLAAGSDYQAAEKRLLEAVNSVFEDYKESIRLQHGHMESAVAPLNIAFPTPESRLYITDNGLSVTLRYPVDLDNAGEIDVRVTRAILKASADEPKLRIIGGKPEAQAV